MSYSVADVPELSSRDSSPAPVQASLTDPAGDELPPPPLPASSSPSPGKPSEPLGFEPVSGPSPVPVSVLVPLPVPAFVNGCRSSQPPPRSLAPPAQDFDGDIIGDDLDKLLDQAEPESAMVSRGGGGGGGGERTCVCACV